MLRTVSSLVLASLLVPIPVRGQFLPIGDAVEDYVRVMQLSGAEVSPSFQVRPIQGEVLADLPSSHPWRELLSRYRNPSRSLSLRLFDPVGSAFWNSAMPAGMNDGALWRGRGLSAIATFGAHAKAGPLSAAIRPIFGYAQNRSYELWPGTEFNEYPGRVNLDVPQRPGTRPIGLLDLGDSYLRVDQWGVAAGVSNENLWWGPARVNSIIMSNNAPGFPHVFLGSSGPVDVRIGHLDTRWIWGRLADSGYFQDPKAETDSRYITGIVLDFQPRAVQGLAVGLSRVFVRNLYQDRIPLDRRDLLIVFQSPLKEDLEDEHDRWGFDEYDQMLAVYSRWMFKESGFELYGEYARGDHSANLRDAVVQLPHAGGYVLGLQKLFEPRATRWIRLAAEIARLEAPKTNIARTPTSTFFYVNTIMRQGYTHRGQFLGAGIGTGSNAQRLSLDLFETWGRAGAYFQRIVYDNDRYNSSPRASNAGHEVEMDLGIEGVFFLSGMEVGGGVQYARILNRFNQPRNDTNNFSVFLTVRRSLAGAR